MLIAGPVRQRLMLLGGIKYSDEEEKLAGDTLKWMKENGKVFSEE